MPDVHRAGDADPDADEPTRRERPHGGEAGLDEATDERPSPVRIPLHRMRRPLGGEDPSPKVGQDHRDMRRPHVDTEDHPGRVLELEDDRAAPATRVPDPGLRDEAGGEKGLHDFRDGGPGEAGPPGDVGPRDAFLVPDKPQDGVRQRRWARRTAVRRAHPGTRRPGHRLTSGTAGAIP